VRSYEKILLEYCSPLNARSIAYIAIAPRHASTLKSRELSQFAAEAIALGFSLSLLAALVPWLGAMFFHFAAIRHARIKIISDRLRRPVFAARGGIVTHAQRISSVRESATFPCELGGMVVSLLATPRSARQIKAVSAAPYVILANI